MQRGVKYGLSAFLVIVLVLLIYFTTKPPVLYSPEEITVTRSFSETTIVQGSLVTVTFNISVGTNVSNYTIVETIPENWTITSRGGGVEDGNVITWDITENLEDDITYEVQTPMKSKLYDFTGTYQVLNGNSGSISGTESVWVILGEGGEEEDNETDTNQTDTNQTDANQTDANQTEVCSPTWDCTGWSNCVDEEQTRTCTDLNDCGTDEDKDPETQICTPEENPPTDDQESFDDDTFVVTRAAATFSVSDEELSEGYTKTMVLNDAIKINVNNEEHTITIKDIAGPVVLIEISSDPIEDALLEGDVKKYDVNGDGIYDIQVTFVAMVSGNPKLTVKSISEEVPGFVQLEPEGERAGEGEISIEEITDEVEDQEEVPEEDPVGLGWFWVLLGGVLALAIIAFFIVKRKKVGGEFFPKSKKQKKERKKLI